VKPAIPALAWPRWTTVAALLMAALLLLSVAGHAESVSQQADLQTDLNRDGVLEQTRLVWDADGSVWITVRTEDGHLLAELGVCISPAQPCTDSGDLAAIPYSGDCGTAAPHLIDFDGDGYDDLVVGEHLLVDGITLAHLWDQRDLAYDEVWNSGNDLRNVWDAEIDDLDQDGRCEIMAQSYHYPGTLVHLYECTGNNSFALSWHADTLYAPSLNSVCGAETDGDGQREAIAGEVGTLGRVYMWECVGDDQFEQRPLGFSMGSYDGAIKDVLACDGDEDGRQEIAVATGEAGGGAVALFEHSGNVGENVYTQVYEYETVSYIFGIEFGDADNDGNQEIILNVGGGTGYPMYVRRLEYNPATQTYEHKMTQPGPIGLPLSAEVADVDGDGENEFIVGAGVPAGGAVYVYETIGDDLFALEWSTDWYIPGTLVDLSIGPDNEFGYPTIASSSFEGQVDLFGYDGTTYVRHLTPSVNMGAAVRSVDHALVDHPDALEDLVLAVSGTDRVFMYEREDAAAVEHPPEGSGEATLPHTALLHAAPNPSIHTTRIAYALPREAATSRVRLTIHDPAGRLVQTLLDAGTGYAIGSVGATTSAGAGGQTDAVHHVLWDGTGSHGSRVESGTYYYRLELDGRSVTKRLVVLR
jgi:hypothetical protein